MGEGKKEQAGKRGEKGSITVFLSLICILFLALICTVTESARVQGAKAQSANLMGIGNFSVLGEFEKELLDRYELFSLDGAYGKGSFSVAKVRERLETYLEKNANPREGIFSIGCFDPWKLELEESEVKTYALLTDEKGEPFYQQAVAFMKANLGTEAIRALWKYKTEAGKVTQWQEEYEREKKENDAALSEAEKTRDEKLKDLESQEDGALAAPEEKPRFDPLGEIAKLRRKSTLEIVTGGEELSAKSVRVWGLPSHGVGKRGTLKLEKANSGALADLLFREYLLNYFPNYTEGNDGGSLAYQLEYLLGGKGKDRENLKYTVNRLLLLREGMNYLYCTGDGGMSAQAGALAATLTGFLGIPALTAATKHALLLAWAYGESLVDVRVLLKGGRIPLFKTAQSWTLTLENLGNLSEILERGEGGDGTGMEYRDYLRILLNLGSVQKQKLRALDMIQENLREEAGLTGFQAENCIVGICSKSTWKIRPVFFSLAQAVMGVRGKGIQVVQTGSLAYSG